MLTDYVLTDYVLSESVKYVSQCDLILDQRFLCVLTEYVLNENDCNRTTFRRGASLPVGQWKQVRQLLMLVGLGEGVK